MGESSNLVGPPLKYSTEGLMNHRPTWLEMLCQPQVRTVNWLAE